MHYYNLYQTYQFHQQVEQESLLILHFQMTHIFLEWDQYSQLPTHILLTLKYQQDSTSRTPFVGKNFNVTRAGIHADGMLKNEEIYNIFDTDKFLNRPALVSVSNTSGTAGIAYWINAYFKLPEERKVDKNSELVHRLKEWVDKQYEDGRVTVLTDEELIAKIESVCRELHVVL